MFTMINNDEDGKYSQYKVELFPKRYGLLVRRFRENKCMSRKEVAKKAGISVQYLGFIERGQQNPTITVMLSIANALDEEVEKFFSRKIKL